MALNVRGTLPDYVVRSISRDKNGIYSGTVSRFHPITDVNQKITLDWLDPTRCPDPGWGLQCVEISSNIRPPSLEVIFKYEGQPTNMTPRSEDITFELDASMNEERIETHPSFDTLKAKYGWDADKRTFQETIAAGSSGQTGLSGGNNNNTIPSPLFGADSWLGVGCIFRKTYSGVTIPSDLFDNIGVIVSAPPDIGQFSLPSGIKNRNWLQMAPKLSRTGNAIRISQEWMLSGPKGWIKEIYDKGQLDAS